MEIEVMHKRSPLLPRDRITLQVEWYEYPFDPARFRRLFMNVWKAIPRADRRIIRERLAGAVVKVTDCDYDSDLWGRSEESIHGLASYIDKPIATCSPRVVCFWSRMIDVLPDDVVEVLIAHELGHAFCHSLPDEYPNHSTARLSLEESLEWRYIEYQLIEEEMSEATFAWGFDQDYLDAYLEEHREELPRPTNPHGDAELTTGRYHV